MNSSVHIDNIGKNIFILGNGPTQGLDDTTLTAEAQYSINISRSNRKFFLFVNATKIYQLKAKHSKIKNYPLCLGNTSRDFSANNVEKNRIKWVCVRFFCRL